MTLQGQVLNQTSAWWMHENAAHRTQCAAGGARPNVSIMRRCRVFPVEFVVRGYLTGMPHYKAFVAKSCMHSS